MAQIRGKLSQHFPVDDIRDRFEALENQTAFHEAYHDRESCLDESDLEVIQFILEILEEKRLYGDLYHDTPMTNDVMADNLYNAGLIDQEIRDLIKHGKPPHPHLRAS